MESAVDDAPGDGGRARIAGIVDSVLSAARIEDGLALPPVHGLNDVDALTGPLQRLFEDEREPPADRLGFRKPLRPPPRPARSPKTVIPAPPP